MVLGFGTKGFGIMIYNFMKGNTGLLLRTALQSQRKYIRLSRRLHGMSGHVSKACDLGLCLAAELPRLPKVNLLNFSDLRSYGHDEPEEHGSKKGHQYGA